MWSDPEDAVLVDVALNDGDLESGVPRDETLCPIGIWFRRTQGERGGISEDTIAVVHGMEVIFMPEEHYVDWCAKGQPRVVDYAERVWLPDEASEFIMLFDGDMLGVPAPITFQLHIPKRFAAGVD